MDPYAREAKSFFQRRPPCRSHPLTVWSQQQIDHGIGGHTQVDRESRRPGCSDVR